MFCNTLLRVISFVLFLGPVCLFPSLSFREVLRGVRASLVRFLSRFVHSHGSGFSSSLRIGGDSSAESSSGRTGGESNRSATIVLRDALGEPPSPLGKGKGKIDEIKYPVGSEYLKSAVQNALAVDVMTRTK